MHRIKQKTYNLLRQSEKYFKTDMVYLAKGGSWLTFGQGFISFSAFLLAIAYANLLPRDTFGTYKYVLSIGGILGALTITGLGTAITRAVAQNKDESLLKAFWIYLRWSIFVTIVAFSGSLYFEINGNTPLSIGLLIIGIFSPLSQSAALYLAFLNGKKDFKRKATYDIFHNLAIVFAIFLTLLVTNNPIVLVFVYFCSYTLAALFFFIMTRKRYPETEKGVIQNETIIYAKHLSVINFLNISAGQIDKVLIFHYLGPIQLAIYAFSLSPISQLMSFLRSINSLSFPKFSNQRKEVIQETLPQKLSRLSIPLVIIVIVYCIAAPFIYKILFPQYLDSVIYSQLYAITLLFFPQEFMRTAITAHSKKNILYANAFSILLIRITCLFILVPPFGIIGAITAILISNLIIGFFTRYFFVKM